VKQKTALDWAVSLAHPEPIGYTSLKRFPEKSLDFSGSKALEIKDLDHLAVSNKR